jgi:hypothetical protein
MHAVLHKVLLKALVVAAVGGLALWIHVNYDDMLVEPDADLHKCKKRVKFTHLFMFPFPNQSDHAPELANTRVPTCQAPRCRSTKHQGFRAGMQIGSRKYKHATFCQLAGLELAAHDQLHSSTACLSSCIVLVWYC